MELKHTKTSLSEWESLPIELLRLIVDKVSLYDDKVRIACVCKSWKRVYPEITNMMNKHHLLLVPCISDDDVEDARASHFLVDIVEKKSLCFLDLRSHMIRERIYVGSSYGWLISVETCPSITVINLFTKVEFQLPPRFTFPDVVGYGRTRLFPYDNVLLHLPYYEYELVFRTPSEEIMDTHFYGSSCYVRDVLTPKIILSSNPSLTSNYVAVAIYGMNRRIAYCKSRGDRWSDIKGVSDVTDIIFCDGELLALTFEYELMSINLEIVHDNFFPPKATEKTRKVDKFIGTPHSEIRRSRSRRYLVGCCGQLLMVIPHGDDPDLYYTTGFIIYKFEIIHCQWKLVTNIGDNVLFLGLSTSLSVPISRLPGHRKNIIYFTDDRLCIREYAVNGGFDNGMYNLETKEVKLLPGLEDSILVIPPPIWILPHV